MSAEKGKALKTKAKDEKFFPTDKHGNIIPGTYQTSVGEVKIKKIEPAKNYDVISLARAMNDDFAGKSKELFSTEIQAVKEALETGMYKSWRPIEKPWNQQDCQRISFNSRCFCGHLLHQHQPLTEKESALKCLQSECKCRAYQFVPSRPEEVGEYWLTKRRDFDRAAYRVKCRCKHTHDQHLPYPSPHACAAQGCGCSAFIGAFACAACDKSWHEHQTVFETETERKTAGRQTGEAWMPFSELPDLAKIVETGIDNPQVETLANAVQAGAKIQLIESREPPKPIQGPSKQR